MRNTLEKNCRENQNIHYICEGVSRGPSCSFYRRFGCYQFSTDIHSDFGRAINISLQRLSL